MIVDTSAIVAVVRREQGFERVETLLLELVPSIGAPTLVETSIVLADRAPEARLADVLDRSEMIVLDFTEEHWWEAVAAHRRYGKGRHPARLNLGDCLVYAIAKLTNEPLLTLDSGFAHTDLELV